MKLEKAIEIITLFRSGGYHGDAVQLAAAEQISIEAMKRTISRRERLSWKLEPLLPGETKD